MEDSKIDLSRVHIAVIPDGNRRWAKSKGLNVSEGYASGTKKLGNLLEWCRDLGIRRLSLWGFSSENFSRDADERGLLFRLFDEKLDEAIKSKEYDKNKIRVQFVGDLSKFPPALVEKMHTIMNSTKSFSDFHLNIFLSYGGRDEIVSAVNRVISDAKSGKVDKVDERSFSKYLLTSGQPDPDLIIRTSGEQRTSGFMPFQACYSELYFCKKFWPDFTKTDFKHALDAYKERNRRFGK